jgi:hypothetical protein
MADSTDELGRTAREALVQLVRERLARKPGGHLIESRLEALDLPLRLTLDGGDGAAADFTRRVTERIDGLLADAVQQAAAFRPGHAHCHRCEGVACEHSRPPSSRHVLIGYAPTGLPRWEDLAQHCLERRHPRVDQLYDDPPALITLVQGRDELRAGMLRAFESPAYELLGQLVAGFFPVRSRVEEGRGVLALTVQVAASRGKGGRRLYGLNLIGRTPSGDGLEQLWDRHEDLAWRKPVRWAQAALQGLGDTRARRPADVRRRVEGILAGLARRLERDQRSRARRTRHAEQRHASGERPTRKAQDDARSARAEALLVDERSGTLVVLGERGRTHFFTPEGRLVSSVRYSREAIERKLRAGIWRPASGAQVRAFHERLPQLG